MKTLHNERYYFHNNNFDEVILTTQQIS